jgi:hypothetical protein
MRAPPAANLESLAIKPKRSKLVVEVLIDLDDGATQSPPRGGEVPTVAPATLPGVESLADFVNERAGSSQVSRSLSASRIPDGKQVIGPERSLAASPPGLHDRALADEPLDVNCNESLDGLTPLVNRFGHFPKSRIP